MPGKNKKAAKEQKACKQGGTVEGGATTESVRRRRWWWWREVGRDEGRQGGGQCQACVFVASRPMNRRSTATFLNIRFLPLESTVPGDITMCSDKHDREKAIVSLRHAFAYCFPSSASLTAVEDYSSSPLTSPSFPFPYLPHSPLLPSP